MNISQELIKKHFTYDPSTGLFTRKSFSGGKKAGSISGTIQKDGYVRISIGNKQYAAHRLAWIYFYGDLDDSPLDHINGDRSDNRICNLRLSDAALNMQNRRSAQSNNKSGFLGVCLTKNGLFRAQIYRNKKQIFLGIFDSAEQAHAAYLKAKKEIHPASTIGIEA